ncbi:hypothetical protein D3879_17465 [Pseudomonas cavernicola]|uniref:Uncharacterized protein n=1 Tax=Pseudomonas cavernicola TaxID=2320866 RepID=A0A418XBL4_9PSED|nr:hypothetical protein D3879_17465 [Pseudomonas cavernicola]
MPRKRRLAMDGPSSRPPPRSDDGGREPATGGPDAGARPFGFFWGNAKRNSPSRAKPFYQPARQTANDSELKTNTRLPIRR